MVSRADGSPFVAGTGLNETPRAVAAVQALLRERAPA